MLLCLARYRIGMGPPLGLIGLGHNVIRAIDLDRPGIWAIDFYCAIRQAWN
jgi:hypothetical protein